MAQYMFIESKLKIVKSKRHFYICNISKIITKNLSR